jgi:hypothetical protein
MTERQTLTLLDGLRGSQISLRIVSFTLLYHTEPDLRCLHSEFAAYADVTENLMNNVFSITPFIALTNTTRRLISTFPTTADPVVRSILPPVIDGQLADSYLHSNFRVAARPLPLFGCVGDSIYGSTIGFIRANLRLSKI